MIRTLLALWRGENTRKRDEQRLMVVGLSLATSAVMWIAFALALVVAVR